MHLNEVAIDAGRTIYGPGFAIDLNVEEGSLKAQLTQLALATGLFLNVVATYSDLKSSIKEIRADTAAFSQYVYKNFFDAEDIDAANRVVKQNRKGVPGQLSIVIKDLEGLKRGGHGLSRRQIEEIMDRSRIRLAAISRQMSEDDAGHLLSLLHRGNLPGLPSDPSEMQQPVLFTRSDQDDSREASISHFISHKLRSSPPVKKQFHNLIEIEQGTMVQRRRQLTQT